MNNWSYGTVVEGTYDSPVYEELIKGILGSEEVWIVSRVARGRSTLMSRLRGYLWSLTHANQVGGPVDKALAIRDANAKDPTTVEAAMHAQIANQPFPFPRGVSVHAVRQEMEAWLLADTAAINAVAIARGGRPVAPVAGDLENLPSAKERFVEILSQARLQHTAEVCREIAQNINLDTLRSRCSSFRTFEQKVRDP